MPSLSDRLSKVVSESVNPQGFRYNKKRNVFIRVESHGFSEILWTSHPTVMNELLGMKYSLVIGVRHDKVEDIFNKLGTIYGEENQKYTATVSCGLSVFPPSNAREYSFFLENESTDKQIESVALSISECFSKDALPFYSKYSSINECAVGLNSRPMEKTHPLCNNLEARMYRAIITAHQTSMPDLQSTLEQWLISCESILPLNVRPKAKARLEKLLGLLENKNEP